MKSDPLFTFNGPPNVDIDEGLRTQWRWTREGYLNVAEVAKWLVRKGVLPIVDVHKPAEDWGFPLPGSAFFADYLRLKDKCGTSGLSNRLGWQVVEHLHAARCALRADGSIGEFCGALCRAQDSAQAAYDAGYKDYPVPEVLDFTTGMIAATAEILCDEIMRRSLAGAIAPGEATEALAALSPQAKENARWFRDRYGGPTTEGANKD